jgi:LPPG:FO 2-phospho-L-lactate transferase
VLVIDPADADLVDAVVAEGMRCIVTPSVMSTPEIARTLGEVAIAAVSAG